MMHVTIFGIKAHENVCRHLHLMITFATMPRLSTEERERAIGMIQLGATHNHVARIFGCSRLTITRLMTRYRQTGRTQDRPRSGRPRVTTPAEDRYLRILHLRNRFLTVTSSASTALSHRVSRRTVPRRLHQHYIRACRSYRGVALRRQHRRQRVRWARVVQGWQRRQWDRVLFTDESRYLLNRPDGRQRVHRRRGERTAR